MPLTDDEKKQFEELIKKQRRLMGITAITNNHPLNAADTKKIDDLRKEIELLSTRLNLKVNSKSNNTLQISQENLVNFEAEFEKRSKASPAIIKADSKKVLDDLIQLYNEKFMESGKYKKGYAAPKVEKSADGKEQVRFEFPDDKSLMAFARELANPPNNKPFTVLDEKGNVLAHSTGDGKLYHGANDPKSPHKKVIEPGGDFQRPKPPAPAPADTAPKPA